MSGGSVKSVCIVSLHMCTLYKSVFIHVWLYSGVYGVLGFVFGYV